MKTHARSLSAFGLDLDYRATETKTYGPPVALALLLVLLTFHLTQTFLAPLLLGAVVVAARFPAVAAAPYAGRAITTTAKGTRVAFAAWAKLHPGPRAFVALVAMLTAWQTSQLLHAPVALAVAWVVGWWTGDPAKPKWWQHAELVRTLIAAKILPEPKVGQAPPRLHFRGKPEHTDYGTTVVVSLPAPCTFTDVLAQRERLAAALHKATKYVHLAQLPDDPADTVRITVTSGHVADNTPALVGAPATAWEEPLRIGRDARGVPVTLATNEQNTLLAGIPGSGKTATARLVLAHFLLDPVARVFLLDGKGSRADYAACVPLCEQYVSGTADDAVADTLHMLETVFALLRERNANSVAGEARPPGVLLLLEEYQDIRAAASKSQRDALDVLLGRIVRQGRAVSVHVVVSTQRPTVEDLPSGSRNLISQRVALQLRNAADAAIVLGEVPTLPLPGQRGQALYARPGATRAVTLDYLTDAHWLAACTRAAALRPVTPDAQNGPEDGRTPLAPTVGQPLALEPAEEPLDPLLGEVVRALGDADPSGLPASQLHAKLPDWTRADCPNARTLGIYLRKHPDAVEQGHSGSSRVWRLTPGGPPVDLRRTPGAPTADPRLTPGAPAVSAEPVVLSHPYLGPDGVPSVPNTLEATR